MKEYHFFSSVRFVWFTFLAELQLLSNWLSFFASKCICLYLSLSILMLIKKNFVFEFLWSCYLQFESINESIHFNDNIFHLLQHELKNKITNTK